MIFWNSSNGSSLSLATGITALASAACACIPAAHATGPDDFYAGKTVTLVVGNPAGSGYDAYARLLARHIPNHITGAPAIIVQNMPGAGSVRAADYTYNIAPKDGTSFTLAMPGTFVEPLTGTPGQFRFDPAKFSFIGTMDSGTRVCVSGPNAKVRSIEEARKTKAIVAATAPTSSSFQYPKLLNALAGTSFSIVTGYQGPADVFLAVDRGEADVACGLDVSTFKALRPNWLGKKTVNMLVQFGLEPNKDLLAVGLPSQWDFISNPEDRKLVELVVAQQVFQRPFMAPPGVPAERVKILRQAFMAAMRDPALLAEAAKQNLDLNPRSGEEVEALIQAIYSTPKEMIDRMAKTIAP